MSEETDTITDPTEGEAEGEQAAADAALEAAVQGTKDEDHPNLIEEPPAGDVDPSVGAAPGDATAAADAAPGAEEDTDAEPPEEIDAYLLDSARRHGMTIEEARGLGAAALSQTLRVLDRTQAQAAEAEPPTPTPEETQRAEEDALYAAKYDLKFPEKDDEGNDIEYNRHARKALEDLNEHYFQLSQRDRARVDALTARQDAADERAVRQHALEVQGQFDTEVAALGKDYEQLFGKGTEAELDENSVAYQNRGKVLREMGVIEGVREANGLSRQPMKATLKQALRSVFPEKETTKAVRQVKGKVKKAAAGLSVAPTDRKTAGKPGTVYEKAAQTVREKMVSLGLDPGDQSEDVFSD